MTDNEQNEHSNADLIYVRFNCAFNVGWFILVVILFVLYDWNIAKHAFIIGYTIKLVYSNLYGYIFKQSEFDRFRMQNIVFTIISLILILYLW